MKWIKCIGMDKLEDDPKKGAYNWKPESYVQKYERTVAAVPDDTSIVINVGVPCTIQDDFGGGNVLRVKPDRRISHCAVEDMTIRSEYNGNAEDEEHGWTAIEFNSIRDSWVRNVTALHFGYACVSILQKGLRITVQDCKDVACVLRMRPRVMVFSCLTQSQCFTSLSVSPTNGQVHGPRKSNSGWPSIFV